MVTGVMDLLLGAETGNCAFAVLAAANERTMLLELVFVLEAIAAPRLHADRFLPLTPVHLMVNHKLEDVAGSFCGTSWERKLQKGSPYKLIDHADIARQTLPAMFQAAARLAETRAAALRESALKEMNCLLGHEVERLQTLARVNDHVRPQEIRLARAEQEELATTLKESRLRLDSVRLIWKGPPEILG
jgi:ATP-dependent helicase HepA